jgi:hypothetical protein
MILRRRIEFLGVVLVPLLVYLTYGSLQKAAFAACVFVAATLVHDYFLA